MTVQGVKDAVTGAPVTSLTAAEAVLALTLQQLVAHHVLHVDPQVVLTQIMPIFVVLWPAVFNTAKWRLATPWSKAKAAIESTGLITDADFGRLEGLLEDKLASVVTAVPVPEPISAVVVPDGMGAGTPAP